MKEINGANLPKQGHTLIKSEIEQVRNKIALLREITEKRLKNISVSGSGSKTDQQYDLLFRHEPRRFIP